MKLFRFIFLIILFFTFLPSYADCGKPDDNKDLDKQCNESICGGTVEEVKGCYLPPDGSKCPEDYPNSKDICCCK